METLLRPAKQLAEWDSTFAQNLDTYFNLLKESQGVNFGEAALVLQHSANVYARRIECLWNETEALSQSLSAHSAEKNADEANAKQKKSRKSIGVIDFNDFELLSLEDFVGKSTNLKKGEQKSLKLLTRRFTQLESNLAQLSSPIEILSAQGEVIGNKYDFRCNQQLTKSCMLVDELTPNDFLAAPIAATPSHEQTPTTLLQTQDSGFNSLLADSPDSIASEEMETNENTCAIDKSTNNIPDDHDAGYTSGDAGEEPSDLPVPRADTTEQAFTMTQPETRATEPETSSSTPETRSTSETSTIESTETSATRVESSASEGEPIRPSENTDPEVLEPIPFEQGVPNPIPRRRAAFKLPCHASLLKTKFEPRKRKRMTVSKKRESLARLLLDNYNILNKKLKTYSPTRQLSSPLKLDDLEELQKSCEQYLKSMQGSESYRYDAITQGEAMELLGFHPNFTKHDSAPKNHTYAAEDSITDSSMIVEHEDDLSSVPESFTTPPPTPEAANHRLNYRELVEQRMKQIGEESREQSDLEQRVADWHKSLRPKLTAAGRRPPFDIHEYGSRIIKTLEAAENQKVPFVKVVDQESAPEVARYFLASLQLANSYNLSIDTPVGDSGCGIELKLLEKDVQHKTLALHEKIDRIRSLSKT